MATKKAKTDATETKVPRIKVTGFSPLKFKEFTITQKRSGRYAVIATNGTQVNGPEKEKLLLEAKLLKGSFKKAPAEVPAT